MKLHIGYQAIMRMRGIEEQANKLGFRFAYTKYGREDDVIGLCPKDDSMPSYARDSELFVGDLESIYSFLKGIEFMTNYCNILKVTSDKKIKDAEDIVRQGYLVERLKNETSKKL